MLDVFDVLMASEMVALICLNLDLVALGKLGFSQGLASQSGHERMALSRLPKVLVVGGP
jgi:hypothetical protein